VYLFENAQREVIYVGKATNLRARVRSYFTADERKRMGDLRAEIADVRIVACRTDVEASALEARLIDRHKPRYNRAGVRRRSPVYLRLTDERHPRFSVAKSPKREGGLYLGPLASTARARAVADTLAGLFGIRTCTLRLNGKAHQPCALYDLGSCHGPCTARAVDVEAHDEAVERLRSDLETGGLQAARQRLAAKLESLAARARFEEAAAHRDAFADAVRAVDRARRLRALAEAGRVELQTAEGTVVLEDGRLAGATDQDGAERLPHNVPPDHGLALAEPGLGERYAVAAWLERATDIRLVGAERPLAYPLPRAAALDRIDL
jgi:DNA polymerase-3 subunit epsilon